MQYNFTDPGRASCRGPTDLCRPTTRRLRWNRISVDRGAGVPRPPMISNSCAHRESGRGAGGQKPQTVLTTVGIARSQSEVSRRRKRSRLHCNRKDLIGPSASRARGTLPQERRGWSACDETADQVGAAIYSKRKRWWSQCFGQINSARLPAISLAWFCRRCKAVGPGFV